MKAFFKILIFTFAYTVKGEDINKLETSDIDERIWRGQDASPGQFPHQALLLMSLTNGNQAACGGSLIRDNVVLTAAHCCDGVASTIVYLGLTQLADRNMDFVQRFRVPASSQVINENYNNQTIANDICLLKLPSSAQMNSNVSTIGLPEMNSNPYQYDFSIATVSGFGQSDSSDGLHNRLLYGRVRMQPHLICYLEYAFINRVSQSQLCTAKVLPWRGPCQGDSGGALFVNGASDKPMEIGIVSWGVGGCSAFLPVVYTYVPYYIDWINQNI